MANYSVGLCHVVVLLGFCAFVQPSDSSFVSDYEDFQYFRPEDEPQAPPGNRVYFSEEDEELIIEDCGEYPPWNLENIGCNSSFPREEFPESDEMDKLWEALDVDAMTGFFYVTNCTSADFSVMMHFEPPTLIEITLWYYSTVRYKESPLSNLISVDDDYNGIVESQGQNWTERRFHIRNSGVPVFFDVSLTEDEHDEDDFFLLHKIRWRDVEVEEGTTTPEDDPPVTDTPSPGPEEPTTVENGGSTTTDETDTTTPTEENGGSTPTGPTLGTEPTSSTSEDPSTSETQPTEAPPTGGSTSTDASTEPGGSSSTLATTLVPETPDPSSPTMSTPDPEAPTTLNPEPTTTTTTTTTTTPRSTTEGEAEPEPTTSGSGEDPSTTPAEDDDGLSGYAIVGIIVGSVTLVGAAAAAGGLYYFKTHTPGGEHARLDGDFNWNEDGGAGGENAGYAESVPNASVYNYNTPSSVMYTGDPNPAPGHILPRLTKIS